MVGSTLMVMVSVPAGIAVLVVGADLGAVPACTAHRRSISPRRACGSCASAAAGRASGSRPCRSWAETSAPTPSVFADQDVHRRRPGPARRRTARAPTSRSAGTARPAPTPRRCVSPAASSRSSTSPSRTGWSRSGAPRCRRSSPSATRWSASAGRSGPRRPGSTSTGGGCETTSTTTRSHDVRQAYEQLLNEAGSPIDPPRGARHRHDPRRQGQGRPPPRTATGCKAAVELLLTEMRLFAQRLEGAGLVVSAPLSPGEWARAMRLRLDPSCRAALDGRSRSLGRHRRRGERRQRRADRGRVDVDGVAHRRRLASGASTSPSGLASTSRPDG